MLQTNKLKARLAAGQRVYGLLSSIPAPLLVEMIGYAGYDFVILDLEHASVNPQTLEDMIRAAEGCGLTPLVRVPSAEPKTILRVLDAGAQGIVVPCVQDGEQARQAVRASRYHPLGERGISGGRTTGFGTLDLPAYMALANREVMVIAMIEDAAGVENIDAIASVPGIDMVLEGAIDLSQSLGVPGQAQHPTVQAAIRRVAATCAEHGVPFCAIPRADGQHATWCEAGVRAFLLGDDRGVSFRALKANLGNFHGNVV
ncbi:HpcH/HpaI aldolase family protein [Undibacterium griseum]|uniref:Siderophore biosynthesis protein SbnG n=1 Tax=Undibacterium griseum TaxID=2762295 RepID=A0ABR6YMX3_9BURK|nr:aldolase/citrate lyase family protein [Undibacterium griseum]MBC3885224.1 siderophore biosynthesis protein SbnG [Undibacterium griseum]